MYIFWRLQIYNHPFSEFRYRGASAQFMKRPKTRVEQLEMRRNFHEALSLRFQ